MKITRIPRIICGALLPHFAFGLSDHFSQSFMFPREGYRRLAIQQAGWHQLTFYNEHDQKSNTQLYGFFQRSSRCSEEQNIPSYFLPVFCDDTITIKGDVDPFRDVRAEYLGLPSDFVGSITLDPHQQQGGFVLEYYHELRRFFKHKFFRHMWVGFFIPFVDVRNNLGLTQEIQHDGTPRLNAPSNALEALDQPAWHFGRLRTCSTVEKGIAEVRLKLGKLFMARDNCEVNLYTMVVFPTFKGQNPKYLFSAFVGPNNHYAFGTGVNFQFPLFENLFEHPEWAVNFFVNIEHLYRIPNHQCRTFDLCGKPWSRFLLLTTRDATPNTQAIPGVNVLTMSVEVKPHSVVEFQTGIRFIEGHIEAEVGYNLFAHPTEEICLNHDWPEIFGIRGSVSGVTASESTISTLAADDDEFVPITFCDINFNSGAARGAITHTAYATLSYIYRGWNADLLLNAGGFIEFTQNNAALKQWGIWGKIGWSL